MICWDFVSKSTFQRGYQQGVAHAWDSKNKSGRDVKKRKFSNTRPEAILYKKDFLNKIRATNTKKFKPYIKLYGKKFFLER